MAGWIPINLGAHVYFGTTEGVTRRVSRSIWNWWSSLDLNPPTHLSRPIKSHGSNSDTPRSNLWSHIGRFTAKIQWPELATLAQIMIVHLRIKGHNLIFYLPAPAVAAATLTVELKPTKAMRSSCWSTPCDKNRERPRLSCWNCGRRKLYGGHKQQRAIERSKKA